MGAAESGTPSHGWVVLRDGEQTLLVHVPPRDWDASFEAAEPGVVRAARPLLEAPEACATAGDRVYLFFPPTPPPGDASGTPVRRVLSLRTEPAGIPGFWTDTPAGILDPQPALTARGRLVDVASAGGSVYALCREPGQITVSRLGDDAWEAVALPRALVGAEPTAVAMVSFGRGVLLAARSGDDTRAWTLEGDAWHAARLGEWGRFWDARWRRGFGRGVILGVEEGDGRLGLWTVDAEHAWRLGSLDDRPGTLAVVLASSARLVLLDRPTEGGLRTREVSLVTGRTVFDADTPSRTPVPVHEFRLIVAMTLLVMVAALFVIVRPAAQEAGVLPEGWALADPGRRMLASLLDLIVVCACVAPLFGVTIRQVLTLQVLIHPDESWLAIPTTLIAGWLAMSVWEAVLGFTPGKLAVGARVLRASSGPGLRLTLFWSLVRNAVKWLMPPVAAMALLDPQGRHRGDSAARAVVVVRAETPPETA